MEPGDIAADAPARAPSVQLPDFWLNETDMWFQKVEASFRRARVTDSHVKYDYVLMNFYKNSRCFVAEISAPWYTACQATDFSSASACNWRKQTPPRAKQAPPRAKEICNNTLLIGKSLLNVACTLK
jgi:hypothetical protein